MATSFRGFGKNAVGNTATMMSEVNTGRPRSNTHPDRRPSKNDAEGERKAFGLARPRSQVVEYE